MQVLDLSHTIENGMPVYPGTEAPLIETPVTIESDGFLEKRLRLFSHTGTHVDAPAHIIDGASTLDQLMIDTFSGKAFLIDSSSTDRQIIDVKELAAYTSHFEEMDFALIHTGWSAFWGQTKYFSGYPVLSAPAAEWLTRFDLKGIGIDACSFDAVDAVDYSIHQTLLNRGFILIENLTNLSGLPDVPFTFHCFPLKIKAADGSPVRAVAMLA